MKLFAPSIVAIGIAVTLAIGCNDATAPVAPTSTKLTPPAPPPAPNESFPALTQPGSIYVADVSVSQLYHDYEGLINSRYVLYDDGTFALQFLGASYEFFQYKGSYSISSNVVQFTFADSTSAGPWTATADLAGNELTVTYNDAMSMDFIDGAYLKVSAAP